MRDIQYTFIDRSKWGTKKQPVPPGPWDNEPDKLQYTDEMTGLPCLIRRNPWMGNLCGYVGVPEGHPWFGKDFMATWDDEDYPYCHGGVTYNSFCQENDKEHGICHLVEPGESDKVWWVGFDCGHCDDVFPSTGMMYIEGATYKDVAYVMAECADLAKQIVERARTNVTSPIGST